MTAWRVLFQVVQNVCRSGLTSVRDKRVTRIRGDKRVTLMYGQAGDSDIRGGKRVTRIYGEASG